MKRPDNAENPPPCALADDNAEKALDNDIVPPEAGSSETSPARGNAVWWEASVLADRGIPVFPCEPGGKRPLTTHGFHDATTDQSQLARWYERWPDANIAIPTGITSFDVLDADVREDGDGWDTVWRLQRAGLLKGAVRIVLTPSGGVHIYFTGTEQRSSSLGSHFIDFKACGGYVLVPPSIIQGDARERQYVETHSRLEGRSLDWAAVRRVLDAPGAYVAPIPPRARVDIDTLARWLEKRLEGCRNNSLYWATCRAIEIGADNLDLLVEAAVNTGLDLEEIERTMRSARAHAGGAPR